jgi:hypothetical protein
MSQGGFLRKRKRDRLEAGGWRVGSAAELLALSPEEAALVEIKIVLSRSLRLRLFALRATPRDVGKALRAPGGKPKPRAGQVTQ